MQDLPSTTEIRGTFRYMPPELIRSRPALRYTPGDTREQKAADIWAVGEISAFLLTGETVYGRFVEDLGYESRLRAPFPSNDLEGVNAAAKEFIKQLLNIDFLRRPFAQQALSDIWLAGPAPVQRGPQRRSSQSGDERPHASASSSNTSNSVHSWPSTSDQSPRHSWDARNRWSSSNPFRSFGGMLSPINEPRAEATAVTDTPGARSRRSLFPSRRSLYAESSVPIAIHSSRSRARTTPDPQIVRLRQVEVEGAARTAPGSVDVGTETERRLASPEVSGQRLPAANKSSRSQFATNKKAMSLLGSMHAGSEGNIYQELNVTALSGIKEPLSWQTMANLDTDPIFAPAGNAVAYRVEDQYCVLDTQTGKSIACGVPIAFANTSRLLAIELDHHGPLIQSFPDGVWRTRLQIPRSSMSREIESENRLILGHFSPSDSYVARLYDNMESLVVWKAVDGSIVNQIKCSVGPVVWKFHPLGGELLLCSPDHFSQNPEDRSTDNNVLFLSWYHAIDMSYARSQAFRYDGSNVQYRPIVALSEDCNTLGVAYGLRGTSRIKVFNMQGQILCDLPGDGKLLAIEPCPSGTLRLLYDSAEPYAFDSRTRKFVKMKDKTWFYHDSAGFCGLSDADGMKLRVRHNAAKKTMDLPFFENVSWLHRKKMLTKACGVVAWSRDGSTVAVRYQKSDKNQTVGEADSTVVEIWSLKSILAPA
jgi:serine/threonine protein kinase